MIDTKAAEDIFPNPGWIDSQDRKRQEAESLVSTLKYQINSVQTHLKNEQNWGQSIRSKLHTQEKKTEAAEAEAARWKTAAYAFAAVALDKEAVKE